MARRPKDDKPITILRVVRGGYEPVSAFDEEMHAGFRLGSEVHATLHQPKNNDQLRLFWWALGMVVENLDDFPDSRSLSRTLLAELGYVDEFTLLMGGGVHISPRSIADMEGPEFNDFVKKAFAMIHEEFGIDVEALIEEGRRATRGRS